MVRLAANQPRLLRELRMKSHSPNSHASTAIVT